MANVVDFQAVDKEREKKRERERERIFTNKWEGKNYNPSFC